MLVLQVFAEIPMNEISGGARFTRARGIVNDRDLWGCSFYL